VKVEVQLDGTVIGLTIADVFLFISEMENGPLWGRTSSTVKTSDGPVSLGTVFVEETEENGQVIGKRTEVIEFDPPYRFSYRSRHENGTSESARITFEEVGDGTLVTPFAEVEVPGWSQDEAPEFTSQMKAAVQALLETLKGVLEDPRTPSP
jgi:uncharacterized protein YndB with AHSA1/START domain